MRGQFERVDFLEAGAIFLDHLARGVGGARTRELNAQIGMLLLESVDERLDLGASGIEEEATLAPGALLQDRLPVGAGVVGDGLDARWLRRRISGREQRRERDQPKECARSHVSLPDLLPEW